jgi:YHS domain-containing protein
MNIKNLIDEVILMMDTEQDATTLLNILRYVDGKHLPDDLSDYTLISPVTANEIDLIIRTTCEDSKIELSENEFNSLIDGDLYIYFCSEYVKLYISKNETLIYKYINSWDELKETLVKH